MRNLIPILVGVAAGCWGVFVGLVGGSVVITNGWNNNSAQWNLAILLAIYALVCLVSAFGIIFAVLLRRPVLTLIMAISQVVAVLTFYVTLLGPGETRIGGVILVLLVTPFIFCCIWYWEYRRADHR